MAIRKSKEKSLQFNGTLEEAKIKCKSALEAGGFKMIEQNESLNQFYAKFDNFFVVGSLEIGLAKTDHGITISLKSTANVDNIYALFSSPNDKIMRSFIDNFK
ncbi:MAG: hypothetical protein IMW88_11650 [Thermoflavifilum sp.]|uniref:hypothetical protein n=1 Tax=Thermoflavifilum sp. TaxID=1968839 RepID=UPI0018A51484|nr:hypothetical protein [Thermoflavifilum sp.]QOR75943.1 MAG: hypothetical protein IMW88_11650 [Thermoflavifilum sp.]